jgi:UrcA family protein
MRSEFSKTKFALLAGAALSSTGAWAAPLADAAVHMRTETVKYTRSHASTAQGAADLYDELRAAAVRVCTELLPLAARDYNTDNLQASCVSEALGTAVRKVGIPMVSVLHQYSSAGRSPAVASR